MLLRTPDLGGFQLLDLHDFPGQGTALIGVLDPFWNPKPYVTAQQFRRFCGPVVPLARMASRVWTSDQPFAAAVDVSQYGDRDLTGTTVEWTLRSDSGQTIGEGRWADCGSPAWWTAKGRPRWNVHSSAVRRASRLTLTVSIPGTPYANDWQIWVYPPISGHDTGRRSARDPLAGRRRRKRNLKQGGKVLLLPLPSAIAGDTSGSFEPVFWNRLWFPTQEVHTLGLLCDPKHAACSLHSPRTAQQLAMVGSVQTLQAHDPR